MAKKRLRDCRSGKDIHKIVKKNAKRGVVNLRPGKGSHMVAKNKAGAVVYPVHNKDLGKGIRNTIIKQLRAIGVTATFIIAAALILNAI